MLKPSGNDIPYSANIKENNVLREIRCCTLTLLRHLLMGRFTEKQTVRSKM